MAHGDPTESINRALAGIAAERRRLSKAQREAQVQKGAREELREHGQTIRRLKRNPKMPVREVARSIAKEHIAKNPEHYSLEPNLKRTHGLKPPRIRLLARRGRLRVYLVDATAVRKMTDKNPEAGDFTMGSGDQVQGAMTGAWQVWISDELVTRPMELKSTMLHEMLERRRMLRDGLSYDAAHAEALAAEDYYRQRGWRGLDAALRKERGQ
jgi:hypothetical protein